MKLSKKEVEHIANLARLKLSDDDADKYSHQLSDILNYIEKMQSVDTEGVEPTSQVTGLVNVERDDKIIESGIDSGLVASAPEANNGYVKVPKVL